MKLRDAKHPFEWLYRGDAAADPATSNARAGVCVTCPLNCQGTLTSWFTLKAASIVQRAIEYRLKRKLTTVYDASLGTCKACRCAMVLKCHEPKDLVLKQLSPKVKAKLWDRCWIRREASEPTSTPTKES